MLEYAVADTRLYPVEVSGWDSDQNFFVEKCDLSWSEEGGKHVRLTQGLRESTIVFVRLLQSAQSELAHPVAYEVQAVGEPQNGVQQFRLKMVAPRLREIHPAA